MAHLEGPQRQRESEGSEEAPARGFQWTSIIRMVLLFMAVQAGIKFILPKPSAKHVPPPDTLQWPSAQAATGINEAVQYARIPESVSPLWGEGTPFDVQIYTADSLNFSNFGDRNSLLFTEKNLALGKSKVKIDRTVRLPLSPKVQNNGSLFAHIYVTRDGHSPNPRDPEYNSQYAYHQIVHLNTYLPKRKEHKQRKLLENEVGSTIEETGPATVVSYIYPNLTLSLVEGAGNLAYAKLPPPITRFITLESSGARDETGRRGWYYPIIFANDFWNLRDHNVEINQTVEALPLTIHFDTTPFWMFQITATMHEGFKQQSQQMGGNAGGEIEELKRVLLETNIWLLGITGIVTLLHTVLEMLAFKSDISHWRKKKDNVGVSVRSILGNVFMQTVIFLYLMDNNDNTSWMILAGQGFGILLEAWKITQVVNVRILPTQGMIPWRIAVEDKHILSDTEQKTKEYDETAFKYVYIIAVPLIVAYAIYSLIYDTHKSWYSFVITTLVGSVYA